MPRGERGGAKKKPRTNKGRYDPSRSIWVRDEPPAPKKKPPAPKRQAPLPWKGSTEDKIAATWAARNAAWYDLRHPRPLPPPADGRRPSVVAKPKKESERWKPPLTLQARWATRAPVVPESRRNVVTTMTRPERQVMIRGQRPLISMDDQIRQKLAQQKPRGLLNTLADVADNRVGKAIGKGAEWVWEHPRFLSEGATWAATHPGRLAHGVRVGIQAATDADVRRLIHPVEAFTSDRAEAAKRMRQFTTWRKKNPDADPEDFLRAHPELINDESIVPWSGPIKGAIKAAVQGKKLARATQKALEPELEAAAARTAAGGLAPNPAVLARHRFLRGIKTRTKAQETELQQIEADLMAGGGQAPAPKTKAPAKAAEDLEETAGGVRYLPGAEPPPALPEQVAIPEPTAFQKKFRKGMVAARRSRQKTERGYSEQRGSRFFNYEQAYANARRQGLGPEEAHLIARKELAGELEKPVYRGMDEFTPEERQDMIGAIGESALRTGEKNRAIDAIRRAIDDGTPPQRSQIALLEKVFDPDTVKKIVKNADERSKYERWVVDVANIPRSLQSAFDVSYLFRQSLTAGIRHPTLWAKSVGPSLRAAKATNHKQFMRKLADDSEFVRAEEGGVNFTGLEEGGDIALREEQFASALADKIPGVGVSQRMYNNFLNDLRLKMWKHHVHRMEDDIYREATRKSISGAEYEKMVAKGHKDLARFINSMTGRGPLGKKNGVGERAAPLLSALFFSPRLAASRFDLLLSPATYLKADPYVRRQALRSMLQTVGVGIGVLAAAREIPGVEVSTNPVATDFGRIKFGNTRIDIWGGFQPQARLLARMLTGKFVGSSGKEWDLGTGGFGQSTRADIMLDFLRSKASPNLSFFWDAADRQNMVGDKFKWRDQWLRLTPILAKDVKETYEEGGGNLGYDPRRWTWDPRAAGGAAGIWGLGSLGVGATTYGRRPPTPPRSSPFGEGGGDPFGGGGGNPFGP